MMQPIASRKLDNLPVDDLQPMLAESRQQGFKFVDTLVDEYVSGKNRFQQPGEALFALFDGASLIAIGGLNRDPYTDDSRVGRIRHVYVMAAYRGQGVGRQLMERLIAEARPYFARLTLRTFTEPADRFYRALGFQTELAIQHATHRLELDKLDRDKIATTFFTYQTAAARYARSRPYFHPLVMDRLRNDLELHIPLGLALDVGCGTGQSTVALKTLAHEVIGVDISAAMLAEAPVQPGIRYYETPAEAIPLPDGSCDLITASLAFHWFDQERFLAEVRRLLKVGGGLVIYNNGFGGEMKENPAFARWHDELYLVRFPSPPRKTMPLTPKLAGQVGLDFTYQTSYHNEWQFTPDEFAAYLTTQSNIIAAVEERGEPSAEVYRWLLAEVEPLFASSTATFLFGGYIWYLRKTSA